MKKKLIALLLSATMITGMLSGCGNDAETPTVTDTAGSSTEDSTEAVLDLDPVTFTFYNADGSEEDPWTDPVALAITEATGVTLNMDYPVDGTDERISLMIAEGRYPDLIFAKGGAASLVEAGALIDMTELIEEYGPNIKALYGDQYHKLRYSSETEAIYQLCSNGVGSTSLESSGTSQLQFDVLAYNDYKVPESLEELESLIKAYMADNPTIDGLNTIGISISVSDWHWYITLANPAGFIADASPDNGQWIINDADNYSAVYKHTTEEEKEYFEWLNRMYLEGILDSDFATQTHDDYLAKISTGRVLCLLDANWDYADAERILENDGKFGRTYAGLPLTMTEETKAASLMDQGLNVGWGVGISVDCKDPVRAIQFIDWLCTDEAQVLVNWGIEDVNYFVDENGMRYRTEEEINASNTDIDYKKTTGVGYHNYPFPAYGTGVEDPTGNTYTTKSKKSVTDEYNIAEKAAVDAWGVEMLIDIFPQPEEFAIPDYSPVWAQNLPSEFNDIATVLDDYAWTGLIKCVSAAEGQFEAEWEKLQSNLKNAGVTEAEEMLTKLIRNQVAFWSE